MNGFVTDLLKEIDINRRTTREKVLHHIPTLITEDHNKMLLQSIEMVELKDALMQMATNKVPEPDGFTMNLFHACWDWMKEEVLKIVEYSRRLCNIL